MRIKIMLFVLLGFLIVQCTNRKSQERPPLAEMKPVEDVYFGKKIVDPYRYMENLKDSNVVQWIREQSDYARSVLNSIPGRQKLIDKMYDFDKRKSSSISDLIITENDRYFYLKTTPADETGKLYYRDGYDGKEVLLYDPATYSKDTTQKYVISYLNPSFDGLKVAFELAPNGSESAFILIMDVNNKKLFPEQIDRCFGGMPVAWRPDNISFLFNRLNSSDVHNKEREKNSKVYLHKLKTDPSNDKEIFSRANNPSLGLKPEDIPIVAFDKSSGYLFASPMTVDNRLKVFYAPESEINDASISWKKVCEQEDEVYNFVPTDKDIYIYTPKNAPGFKILKTSLEHPDIINAEVIVPEDAEGTITSFGLTNEGLYYTVSRHGVTENLYRLPYGAKKATELKLPFAAGQISLSTRGFKFSDIWVTISGWTSDPKRYRYLPDKDEFKSEYLSTPAEYPEYEDLTVDELMIPSYDGVKVPLSLIYKKGLKKNGNTPVFIFGYGAYGMSISPGFSPNRMLWISEGGILAVAHIRGGGEMGENWHQAGFKTTKANTWKDLISCAEYLINEKYTSPKKIAINSASAGGILIGRAMTERPDLFSVAIPMVGVLNPVRMEEVPNGPANIPEFGTVKDSIECSALIEMDSYLHLKKGEKYPATLITAGMNDPRVIVWQPAKFAALLEADNASDRPILFWTDYEAGHGLGNTKSKQFDSMADVLSFALWQTGNPEFQIK
jgi:prolyl oligopeptidase